ncbi:hypothetical protein [Kitasatospora fiedleri]|uniref:hypothetical protein n=1 Tax=Kitasatospora fiedleri TaxID=2991545 RepID=UPI00249CAF85|nr:hypothetical protein [Kitasatospora fiedleri]
MPSSLAEAISTVVKSGSTGSSWQLATVSAVGTGTVDLTASTGPVSAVRRLKGYSSPAVGETVLVLTSAAGNWIVVGALA